MTEDTFLYLWDQGIVKAAKDVVAEISPDLIEKYNVKLNTSDLMYDKLYKEYHKFRKQIRNQYFDVGQNDENLMDGHKICSCITGSLLNIHLVSFNINMKDIPMPIVYSNYAVAFLAGIYIQYLFLLSDYKRDNNLEGFSILKNQATFYFPETNPGHDSHIYAFYNTRNHKSIEIMYDTENECFEIYSTDCLWKYSKDYNSYKYDTLREALCAPWQHLNYIMVMERNNSNKKKRRNRTIQTQKYKEEKIAVKKEMQHFEACNW